VCVYVSIINEFNSENSTFIFDEVTYKNMLEFFFVAALNAELVFTCIFGV